MADAAPDKEHPYKPSPINGPAFLVFGLVMLVYGISKEILPVSVIAGVIAAVGVLGIMWQRRYEKAEGIEEVLPGGRPDWMDDQDKDDSST